MLRESLSFKNISADFKNSKVICNHFPKNAASVFFLYNNFKLLKIKWQNSSLPQNLFVPLHKIVSVQHKTEEPITGLPAGVSLPCVYTANGLWWLFGSDCDIWFVFIVLTQNKRLHSKHTVWHQSLVSNPAKTHSLLKLSPLPKQPNMTWSCHCSCVWRGAFSHQ